MIFWSTLFFLLLVSAFALEHRNTQSCEKFGTIQSGSYSILQDLWGTGDTTPGSQCSSLEYADANIVSWSTCWEWEGDGVKSFSNAQLEVGLNKQLSAISSMQSKWDWCYETSGTIVADVAYDLFTAAYPGGPSAVEVMVWLANMNAGPISYHYDAEGNAIPTEKNLCIVGHYWDLYSGSNGYNEVYSFLPGQGAVQSFQGDVYRFFAHLIHASYISDSQYIKTVQAGTEATSGKAVFKTSVYSITIA